MAFKIQVPARINILGNPSDANEGDFATISTAVDIHAHATIEKAESIILVQKNQNNSQGEHNIEEVYSFVDIPLPYNGSLDLVKGAVNRLYQYSQEFKKKIERTGFKITTWTDVPRQSGLGGSSLFVIMALGGLRRLYDLDDLYHNDYVLAELTQRVEAKDLGITAGYADRYVPIFGGIAYLDYRGKLHQKPIHEEPYTSYERLDPWVDELPLIAVCSGVRHDSGDVHGRMRPRYLEEHQKWIRQGGSKPPMVRFMSEAWETAWKGKIALIQKDWTSFGQLMIRNHTVVDQMMTYCGFDDGAGWANNLLIQTALDNGAFGAKLTGAGNGGSVFAVIHPGRLNLLKSAWETSCRKAGLENAVVFKPGIDRMGLVIKEI